ncbi:MAG TPA: twin transmembrane helix small protein [Nitrosomonas sp.]|nr:twin transmembrane helix small protein [Nitrosomonas sp.]HMV13433.1 twin transmembrane helix small protein [Nitrosomonas sp.]HMW19760.1 twin transmembrane helix small protein [Nitrosomonas sp.]HMW68415.1 twin transmembrane helix small protein [Nitrosomonas sp.]HMY61031.1 twin transmembrane helix small protein [Nitrosomonas sp.]
MKIFAIVLLILILYSLGSGLYFMLKDDGSSTRMVKSLTIRIALSLILFITLMISTYFNYIYQG